MRSWRLGGLVVEVEHFDVARSRQQFASMCGVDFDTGPSVPAVRSALILGDPLENRAGSSLDSVSSGGSSGRVQPARRTALAPSLNALGRSRVVCSV